MPTYIYNPQIHPCAAAIIIQTNPENYSNLISMDSVNVTELGVL